MRVTTKNQVLRLLAPAVLVAVFCTANAFSAPITYLVTVNTSAISGSLGFLDFDFAPGPDSQDAFANISNFSPSGSLTGAPEVTGGASGTLPGTLTIDNSAQFNDYFRGFNYGGTITFLLSLGGPALTSPDGLSSSGNTFAFGMFDQSGNKPLLTTDPNGNTFIVNLNLDGTATPVMFSSTPGGPPVATLNAVPEPSSLMLVALCLMSTATAYLYMCGRRYVRNARKRYNFGFANQ